MHLLYKDRRYLYKHTNIHIFIYKKKEKRAGKTEHTKPETQCTGVQTTQLYLRI